jgi:hypothetical protein
LDPLRLPECFGVDDRDPFCITLMDGGRTPLSWMASVLRIAGHPLAHQPSMRQAAIINGSGPGSQMFP